MNMRRVLKNVFLANGITEKAKTHSILPSVLGRRLRNMTDWYVVLIMMLYKAAC